MSTPPLKVVKGGDSRNKQIRLALYMIGGVAALGISAFLLLGFFIFPGLSSSPETAKIETSRTNLLLVSQALRSYADTHDGRFPRDKWMDQVEPGLANPLSLRATGHSTVASIVGYVLNRDAVGAKWDDSWTETRILIFEQLDANPNATGDPADATPRGDLFVVLLGNGTVKVLTDDEFSKMKQTPTS